MAEGVRVTLGPNSSDSHQTSPSWVITVLRWKNRTSSNVFPGFSSKLETRRPLVIENDAIKVTAQTSKRTVTPGFSVVLKGGDINYATAVAPGDFVFINMLNSENVAKKVAEKARALGSINGLKDGFKGIYKVKSCRRRLAIAPDGTRQLVYVMSGFAFTELNNVIYFTPFLFDPGETTSQAFIVNMGAQWRKLVNKKSQIKNQDVIALLLQIFIGNGFSEEARKKKGVLRNFNSHYLLPEGVGQLLGVKKAEKVADITNVLMGVQRYNTGIRGGGYEEMAEQLRSIFDPGVTGYSGSIDGRFYTTANKIQGLVWIKPEYWSQVQAWSILQQYLNAPMNEAYTSFRIATDSSKIMPTVTVRQIPFTKDNLVSSLPVTRYLSMPRWVITPDMVTAFDFGRDDAARVNFVQMFGRSTLVNDQFNISNQIAKGNYVFDEEDVSRHGLRPYIVSSNSDFPAGDVKGTLTPQWKDIVADAVFDGHLRENGSVQVYGLEEPVDVGDNLQFGPTIYHIEDISHECGVNGDGSKYFRSNISLSHGIDYRSNSVRPVYPEMVHTDYLTYQEEDYEFERMIPGVSDVQDVIGRQKGERPRKSGQGVGRLSQAPFNPGVTKRRE